MIYYYLNEIGVNATPVNSNDVIPGVIGHSFVVVSFETQDGEKKYLLDPTYIQFFSEEKCGKEKYLIIDDKVCVTPDPGYFVVQSNGEDVILPLLENGYIELTEEVAKIFGDSFFKTKQGVLISQLDNYYASGVNYIKWFENCKSNLSLSKDELNNMNLFIHLLSNNIDRIR